jgi:hypothetical protein
VTTSRISVVAIAVLAGACAMSEQAYDRIALEIHERNRAHYFVAEAELRERGYTFADEAELYAGLDQATRDRCQAARYSYEPSGPEPGRVQVVAAVRVDRPRPEPTELEVVAADACAFFTAAIDELDARHLDGTPARVVRLADHQRLARDRDGRVAVVTTKTRVISRQRVRVDMTCDRTPRIGLDPLEGTFAPRVVMAPVPPTAGEIVVDEEQLEPVCTKTVW